MGNQDWKIQRNWQHWVYKTQKEDKQTNKNTQKTTKTTHHNMRHNYTQANTTTVNNTWAFLQTTGSKDE